MMVANKGSNDMDAVSPENFQHDFVHNGIFDKANVTLHEISKIPQNVEDSDYDEGGEGGEDENEEMDNGSMDDNQINDVEPKEVEEEPPKQEAVDQKASEVLFDNDNAWECNWSQDQ